MPDYANMSSEEFRNHLSTVSSTESTSMLLTELFKEASDPNTSTNDVFVVTGHMIAALEHESRLSAQSNKQPLGKSFE